MIETDSIARDSSAASVDLSKETSVRELDRSCRMPVLFLLWKSAGWLFLGSLFALLNSFRFYDPDFLSHYSWLTFGRVRAAGNAAFIYGFALQSAMGAALWLLVRMGRTALARPGYVGLGVAFWNFGVLAGVVGILAGDGAASYELFEIPKYAVPILFVAYSIVGGLAFVTFWRRRARELYISQWFLFAALLWFPWIFSAAGLLLHFYPVRGVAQAVIAGWYAAGLKTLVLGSVGLAVIFYLIPKLLRRPLHSRYLALFSFWLLLFFGNGAGILSGTTVPSWISGLSAAMSFFVCFAAIMIGWNLYLTMGDQMRRLCPGEGSSGGFGTDGFDLFGGYGAGLVAPFGLPSDIGCKGSEFFVVFDGVSPRHHLHRSIPLDAADRDGAGQSVQDYAEDSVGAFGVDPVRSG